MYIATSATSATTIAGSQIVLIITEIPLQASAGLSETIEYGNPIISLDSCLAIEGISVG